MIMGIVVLLFSLIGIVVVVGLKGFGRWHHRLWPMLTSLVVLAFGGTLQMAGAAESAVPAPTTSKSSSQSSSSIASKLSFGGKLDIDGEHFQADYDQGSGANIELTFKAGDKLNITDDSNQNSPKFDTYDEDTTDSFWFNAETKPAVLHIRIDHRTTYQTATVTIDPDPAYASKSSSASVAASASYAESASREAASASIAAAASKSASLKASASESASIAASQSKASQAAAASAQAEQNKYNTGITFDQLARDPDTYYAKLLHLTGEVVQVLEGDGENDLRVAIDGDYDKIVMVVYDPAIMSSRVLENDKITFYGMSMGTVDYESAFGVTITVPEVIADKIADSGKAPSDYGL